MRDVLTPSAVARARRLVGIPDAGPWRFVLQAHEAADHDQVRQLRSEFPGIVLMVVVDGGHALAPVPIEVEEVPA